MVKKIKYLIMFCIIYTNFSFCEDSNECDIEMIVHIENVNISTTISFQPISATWDENHNLITSSSSFSISFSANAGLNYMGCDFIGSNSGNSNCITNFHPNGHALFPYGKFIVSSSLDTNVNENYSFIFNSIDSDYPYNRAFGTDYGPTNDFALLDDGTNFFWEQGNQTDPDEVDQQINPDSVMSLWELCGKDNQSPNQVRFQPTIPEGLTYSNTNNHPDIEWRRCEPYNGNVTYKVKRKNPNQSSYNVIASGLTDTSYIDTDVDICCGSQLVEYNYKIEAVSGDGNKTSGNSSPLAVRVKEGSTVKKEIFNNSPNQFSIKSFPNPFNPETTIKYELPEQSHVQLTIFDLLGRKINTFKNQRKDAGFYSIKWDGRDENGNPLSSGMYIIHISAQSSESNETFSKSQKVVLLK